MSVPVRPPTRWAQRKDVIYLQLDVADIKNENIQITEKNLTFKSSGGDQGKLYELDIEFFEDVTKEGSKFAVHGKSTELVIKKKTPAFWPRLTKSKIKYPWLTIDWSKWVDEDDVGAELDTSYMDDFGGGPGASDFNADDSDDDKDEDKDEDKTTTKNPSTEE
eukprot:TRINITY_DN14048_c0_g1_i1.p1 TRINITY_DN14048_c0_g1~~TRINITY_DN14048_c0_g1_i1.p1  ORF type:complete len:163 (+),score=45.92 TRINITY_DN14048_c0_g1_i1:77-565(+)